MRHLVNFPPKQRKKVLRQEIAPSKTPSPPSDSSGKAPRTIRKGQHGIFIRRSVMDHVKQQGCYPLHELQVPEPVPSIAFDM